MQRLHLLAGLEDPLLAIKVAARADNELMDKISHKAGVDDWIKIFFQDRLETAIKWIKYCEETFNIS